MDLELDKFIGLGIDYTGDMCNPSGRGAIVAVREQGRSVDITLDDGRQINAFPFSSLAVEAQRRGCLHRIIVTGPLHDALYLAQLASAAAIRTASESAGAQVLRATFVRTESARVIEAAPLFFYNGIKDARGAKLQKCFYSDGQLNSYPSGTLTIYARDYARFSARVRACFSVTNDTDSQTDYFCKDTIRVMPSHPLYSKVREAMQAQASHRAKRASRLASD